MRPHDSLWDGAHDARLTGDVVDEIPGGKVDRADWSGVPDDLGDGVCPHHKLSLPYRTLSSCQIAQVFKDDATRFEKSGARRVRADLAGWVCAAWAVLGPWCEIHLAPGLERGLLMVIRKGHHPEGLGSGHREGEDKEVVIVVLTGAPNLLLEALTLNGGYSHHLSSHTLSPIRLTLADQALSAG